MSFFTKLDNRSPQHNLSGTGLFSGMLISLLVLYLITSTHCLVGFLSTSTCCSQRNLLRSLWRTLSNWLVVLSLMRRLFEKVKVLYLVSYISSSGHHVPFFFSFLGSLVPYCLCINKQLKEDHHLKHGGRMQLCLFLKAILFIHLLVHKLINISFLSWRAILCLFFFPWWFQTSQ